MTEDWTDYEEDWEERMMREGKDEDGDEFE